MPNIFKAGFNAIADVVVTVIGNISWKQKRKLSEEQKQIIMELLTDNYLIILTRHSNFLSTYAIGFANLFLTWKFGYYSHVLMNLEDTVSEKSDFRLLEATRKGVTYSTFDEVFGTADAVCFLKPGNMALSEWTMILDKAKMQLGKEYDTLYDLANDTKLSCVELVRNVLMASPDYSDDFPTFEAMIAKSKNLAPQMFRDCPDFGVVLEIKAK